MTMTGLFFKHDTDDDDTGECYFKTGEIVRAVGPDHYLVRIDNPRAADSPLLPLALVSLAEMTDKEEWRFCETRAELDAYIAWETTIPDEDKEVLSFAARRKRH
jgi:hypothetical protein